MNKYSVTYVCCSDLIPSVAWEDWFWDSLSNSSDFTFGDCDHSLVGASRFLDVVKVILEDAKEEGVITDEERGAFVASVLCLGDNVHIDLEN